MLVSMPIEVSAYSMNEFYNENDILYHDPSGTAVLECGTTSGSVIIGDSGAHVLDAFRYFMSQKDASGAPMKDYMAAGIIGNLQQESSAKLNSGAQENGSSNTRPRNGVGFGIAQWTFSARQNKLVSFIDNYNKENNTNRKYTDFGLQLAYLYHELTTDYESTFKALSNTKDEVDAAIKFHDGFEGSADSAEFVRRVRGGNATRELTKFRAIPGNDAPNDTVDNPAAGGAVAGCSDKTDGTGSGSFAAKIDGKCTQNKVQITGENSIPGGKVKDDVQLVVQCVDGYFTGYIKPYGTYNGSGGHASGVAVDLMIPDYKSSAGREKGWAIAKWLQEHKKELGIHYLIFADRIWNVDRDSEGWRKYNALAAASSANDSSRHLNHVHVETWGNEATGLK